MKTKVLTELRKETGYLSGQDLCNRLGVSRTAVWKVIKQLEEEGYTIEAIRNKGYKITGFPDVLTKEELESKMTTSWIGKKVIYQEEIDSTNTLGKHLAEDGAEDGTLVVAEYQSKGRGSRGRDWESPKGEGIFMTLILKPKILPQYASMLTLVMAVSVAKASFSMTGIRPGIKWPNDIVFDGKKVCGILTEMSAQIDYVNHIVIGVGLNVNNKEFPESIKETATSYLLQGNPELGFYNRSDFIVKIMENFEENYKIFLKSLDLSELLEEYESFLVNKNREVRVLDTKEEWCGLAKGITPAGGLIVVKEDGSQEILFAGEVSVRGVYGYV